MPGNMELQISRAPRGGAEPPAWRSLLLRLLLGRPGDLRSVLLRVLVTLVIVAGAVAVVGSGVIHLYLWGKQYGYRDIPTIGPLFLIQGIACILIGLLVVVSRHVVSLLIGAGTMVVSLVALILAVEVGLFGFKDSWLAPYALTSLYGEIAGAVLLLGAAAVLARAAHLRWAARRSASR